MRSLLLALLVIAPTWAEGFQAGTAKQVITPKKPLWMAGYASRNKPCDTKQHDLWVKALAIQSPDGRRCVLLTCDLCGIPRSVSEPVCLAVMRETGLKREDIMLTCSHTHCGPVVRDNLIDMYEMPPEQADAVREYTGSLRKQMIETILASLKDLGPATLAIGEGTARFAVNRRQVTEKGVINGTNPTGPVDHSVPVLRVLGAKDELKAVVFGYACHNTTLSFYEWCGDYAGFAQIELEKKHPEAMAMFWIGCGGDANPLPRGKLELCQKYGKELALAVEDTLSSKLTRLTSNPTNRYAEVSLAFDTIPGRDRWVAEAENKSHAIKTRAKKFLTLLDAGKPIPDRYPHYPVQVWKFGEQLTWVSLGGEVVIDYNLRLKKELPGKTWITGYANDVLAYVPSERVLKEGGYEGESSQIYYGHPTKWATGIEKVIVDKVKELAK